MRMHVTKATFKLPVVIYFADPHSPQQCMELAAGFVKELLRETHAHPLDELLHNKYF